MLEFEHLIQINDLNNPQIKSLSREQLWHGLLLRARNPDKFNSALACRNEDISDTAFFRFTKAGESEFKEKVELLSDSKIRTRVVNDEPFYAESHTTIEEPEAGSLFVRFRYKRDLDNTDTSVDVGEHLKSAYVQVDREAIATIRLLADKELTDSVN